MNKEKVTQIKFTVNQAQFEKLELLANSRELSIPQFCKLTSLQVRVQPAKPVVIEQKSIKDCTVSEEEVALLEEIVKRHKGEEQYLKSDTEFYNQLYDYAMEKLM